MTMSDFLNESLSIDSPRTSHSSMEEHVANPSGSVLVTGGAGFIGYHTCKALLKRGNSVIIVDELNDYYDVSFKEKNLNDLKEFVKNELNNSVQLKIYIGDICNIELMEKIFNENTTLENSFHSIIHLAARAGVRPSIANPLLYINSNIIGTTVLLDLAKKYNILYFIYASSSSVYGGSEKTYFTEEDIVDFPISPYAATKKSCELLAYTYYYLYNNNKSKDSIHVFKSMIGLRFFTVYGPRGRPDMAPYKFIDKIYKKDIIEQYGDGTSSRDYTYIDDIVDGILRSLDFGNGYNIYNLGNGSPVYLYEFIKEIEKTISFCTSTNIKSNIKIVPDQLGDVPRTCADITKAKEDLGYFPKVTIQEGLNNTIKWYIYDHLKDNAKSSTDMSARFDS